MSANLGRLRVNALAAYPLDAYRQRCLALGADFFRDKSKDLAAIPLAPRGS